MSTSIFGIGVSGLNAAQAGLLVTSHNIANASLEGFHRQEAVQGTQTPQETGAGFFGKGATVETVRRSYSQFLDLAVLQAQTQGSYLDAYSAQISQLDNLLADPTAGLSPALQSFFSGVQDVASNPASVPSRQQMISQGQALVTRFQNLDSRLAELHSGVNSQLSDVTAQINTLAQNIANLNQEMIKYQGSPNKPPNDLLDKRESLISDLNKLVRASVVTQSDGSINVFIGNGQSLVLGVQPFQLSAGPSAEDPQQFGIFYRSNGNAIALNSTMLQGGQLGGLLAFRSQTLNPAQNQLGRVAIAVAQTFNDQHRLGQDLNGNLGQDFFNVPAAAVVSSANNTGTAVVSASNTGVSALTASDYRLQLTGATWTLTRLSDNTQSTVGSFPQTIDGVTLNLASGAAASGDSFLIQPTRYGSREIAVRISDTSMIAAAAPIRSAADTANTGQAKVSAGVVVDTTNAAFATPGALTPPVLIQFTSPSQFSIYDNTNPASPVLIEAGVGYNPSAVNDVFPTPGAVDYGYRLTLTGAVATGDRFTVGANTGGVADNRNALLLAQLQTKNTMLNGTANFQSAYTQLVSSVGNQAREIQVQGKAQDALIAQTKEAQQALSGVNMDEEAANLVRFQQAYEASARVLQTASKLFDTILAIGQ